MSLDGGTCNTELFVAFCCAALEKLKETVQSETSRKGKVGLKFSRVSKGEKKSLEE